MTILQDRYHPNLSGLDEVLHPEGTVRDHWRQTGSALAALGVPELQRRQQDMQRLLAADGATYRLLEAGRTEPWKLDAVPFVVSSTEWAAIESGVIQRAVLLDLILRDLYGERKLLGRNVIPPELIMRSSGFLPACDDLSLPGGGQLFTYAVDLGRAADGRFAVTSDYAQAPSGAGYALENRVVLSRVFPSLYRDSQVHRVAPFFRALRAGLEALGEPRAEYPRIVVLTPGAHSETAFEHAFLASYLGFTLVEGGDLVVRDGAVYLRALGGLEPVDVILRRVDAAYSDPLELRPESQLGVPGLLEACRRGSVVVANSIGSGAIETPALGAYLEDAARALLGQELQLAGAPTWWCGDATGLRYVLDHFDELIVKPVDVSDSIGSRFPSMMSSSGRAELRARIEAEPGAWCASEPLSLSTTPTLTAAGLQPRRFLLRTYAVASESSYRVMAGGLTRVAPEESSALITNQRGAIAKDTWVLSSEPEPPSLLWLRSGPVPTAEDPGGLSERAAENLFWVGRYLERSESVVRLLRVIHDRRNDQTVSHNAGERAVEVLLQALSMATFTLPRPDDSAAAISSADRELFSLACEVDRPGSLAFGVSRLLDAAEAVRDQLSTDTWQVTATLEGQLQQLASVSRGHDDVVQGALGGVLHSLLALHGLAGESMVRDVGWYFMETGRRIERCTFMTTLLRATLSEERDVATDSLVFESVLVAAESIVTYRRRYRSRAQVSTLLDLLINDPGNPRSLRYQVDRLDEAFAALPSSTPAGSSTVTDARRSMLLMSTHVRLADTAELSATQPDGRRADLEAFLDETLVRISQSSTAITEENFHIQPPQRSMTAVEGPAQMGPQAQ